MTEAQVGFLCKAAASFPHNKQNNEIITMVKSYYLMRCQNLTRGFGLPDKHFSSKVRCPRCCTEWKEGTLTKVKQLKLSKKQKRSIRHQKSLNTKNKELQKSRSDLLISNQVEQLCTFCKTSNTTVVLKPKKMKQKQDCKIKKKSPNIEQKKTKLIANLELKLQQNPAKKRKITEVNLYSSVRDIFSLKDKNNTLESAVKEIPKVIVNNKKKKDKFAGLCQKAVLASAKLKQDKQKQNKLNLFLKPSST